MSIPINNTPPAAGDVPHIQVRNIAKRYGGAAALDGVSLEIQRGTVHALLGENGAGKSTLGKVIAGIIRPDEGEVLLSGKPVSFKGPRDALHAGVTAMAQELALVPARSVVDNVFLGVESRRLGIIDSRETSARYRRLAKRVGFELPATAKVGSLRLADRQKVEIMGALARGANLIVMDEPTAALSGEETQQLDRIIRNLASSGTTIVYISHFLEQVLGIADTVSVLRDGKLVRTSPAKDETPDSLVTAMLGRSMDVTFPDRSEVAADAPVALEVTGLTDRNLLQDVSLSIRAGEIVGLAGLVGSGRSEVAQTVFGATPGGQGNIKINGQTVKVGSPRQAVNAGLALLPESRKEQGLFMGRSITENIMMAHLSESSHVGVTSRRTERQFVSRISKDLNVEAASFEQPVASLSGGNQQKVLFGKWLVRPPRVLIADEPTRGVDIGAKRAIYNLITGLASQGMAVLLISSEIEEVLGLAHRVLVMRQGEIVNELEGNQMTPEAVMRSAFATGAAA